MPQYEIRPQYMIILLLVLLTAFSGYQTIKLVRLNSDYLEMATEIKIAESRIKCSERILTVFSNIRKNGFVMTPEDITTLELIDCENLKI